MSNRRNQRLPDVVYLRRRVAAVVAILVLVALVVWGLVAFANRGSDDGEPTPVPTSSAEASPASDASEATGAAAATAATETTETSETTATSEDTETTSETSEASETTEITGITEPKESCGLSDLRIAATSDRPTYTQGAQPTFYMTVDNPTAADCEIDLDEATLRFEVYDLASNRRVWADTDCFPSVETGTRTFPAGEERHFEAVWSRMGSQPGQCTNRQPVPDGSYFLHAVIGDNPSGAHTFNLS